VRFSGPPNVGYRLAMAKASELPRCRNDRGWCFMISRLLNEESDNEGEDGEDSDGENNNFEAIRKGEDMIIWIDKIMGN
jgi:hypothetical protein